mmetsp:Transcript_54461/g.145377  ORF Transcript_54461/g.145377 Transcript_54461/m.145377 type:complete len:291 (+) Transcript_54461:271-1143(+)
MTTLPHNISWQAQVPAAHATWAPRDQPGTIAAPTKRVLPPSTSTQPARHSPLDHHIRGLSAPVRRGFLRRIARMIDTLLLVHHGHPRGDVNHPPQALPAQHCLHPLQLLGGDHGVPVVEIHRRESDALAGVIVALELQGPAVGAVGLHADINQSVGHRLQILPECGLPMTNKYPLLVCDVELQVAHRIGTSARSEIQGEEILVLAGVIGVRGLHRPHAISLHRPRARLGVVMVGNLIVGPPELVDVEGGLHTVGLNLFRGGALRRAPRGAVRHQQRREVQEATHDAKDSK